MDTSVSLDTGVGGHDCEDAGIFPAWATILLEDPRGEKRD